MTSKTIYIHEPGEYGPYHFSGNRSKSLGIVVDQKVKGKIIIKPSIIENSFVPITFKNAYDVTCEAIHVDGFGGDCVDIWSSNKQVTITSLYVINNTPTRPYKEYHQDLIQIDNLGKGNVIHNINMPRIEAYLEGENTQGIILTGSGIVDGLYLGSKQFWVLLDGYPHIVSAFQVMNAVIGGKDNMINGDILLRTIPSRNANKSGNIELVGVDLNKYSSKIVNISYA